jgi:cytochrome c oxidase subunit 6a
LPSVVIPCLILGSINAKNLWDEHWEHWSHLPPLEERVEYPYQNIRTRNFFWGDGDKVSISWIERGGHKPITFSRPFSGTTK